MQMIGTAVDEFAVKVKVEKPRCHSTASEINHLGSGRRRDFWLLNFGNSATLEEKGSPPWSGSLGVEQYGVGEQDPLGTHGRRVPGLRESVVARWRAARPFSPPRC